MQELHGVLSMSQYGWACLNRTSMDVNIPEYIWYKDNRKRCKYASHNP